jgi:hypothetical protein
VTAELAFATIGRWLILALLDIANRAHKGSHRDILISGKRVPNHVRGAKTGQKIIFCCSFLCTVFVSG